MSDLLLGLIIYASLTLLTFLLVLGNRRLNHWRQLGVSHSSANLFFGNLLSHGSLGEIFDQAFRKFKNTGEPFCGLYLLMEPTAFVLDQNLVYKIFSKDLSNFSILQPSFLQPTLDNCNLLEANKQVLEKLSIRLTQAVNVNQFCNQYMSAIIALIYGASSNIAPTSSFSGLRKWRYSLGILYETTLARGARNMKLAINKDIAASLMSCMLLKLARNQDLQQKIRLKMLELRASHKNLDADSFIDVKIIDEELTATLNDYAPNSHIILRTLENYPTQLAGYTLEKNRLVIIPLEAFTKYEKNFDLKVFNMYTTELLLVKAALLFVLNKYNFDICKETPVDVLYEEILPHKVLKTKIYLKVQKL